MSCELAFHVTVVQFLLESTHPIVRMPTGFEGLQVLELDQVVANPGEPGIITLDSVARC